MKHEHKTNQDELPASTIEDVIRVSIDPRYVESEELEYGTESNAEAWGLPNPNVVMPVARALVDTLLANGIDLRSVVLSGYDRRDSQTLIDDRKRQAYGSSDGESSVEDNQAKIQQITSELQRLYEQGILSPSRRQSLANEIKELREANSATVVQPAKENSKLYFFADHEAMFDNHTGIDNPVLYAGGGEGATIGVYRRSSLTEVGGGASEGGDIYMVETTREDLEAAKVLEAHIHYAENN